LSLEVIAKRKCRSSTRAITVSARKARWLQEKNKIGKAEATATVVRTVIKGAMLLFKELTTAKIRIWSVVPAGRTG